MKKLLLCLVGLSVLSACSNDESTTTNASQKPIETSEPLATFTAQTAKENLVFTKQQYFKMINKVESGESLHLSKQCESDPSLLCYPRAKEHGAIFMERPEKWTNGFYPGLFWKLLASDRDFDILTDTEEQQLKATALPYQYALTSESLRGSTHDLGFILYDSFGEALEYEGLAQADRASFKNILNQGRQTLTQRYSAEHKVIKSWDFVATFRLLNEVDGKVKDMRLPISAPWSYPVIVDNMMNLEFLLSGSDKSFHDIAFNHAQTTLNNHYFYEEDDTDKARPISYHLIDYDTMRPGNWQGMGAISAWARGQAWSYYGFVTVLESLQNGLEPSSDYPSIEAHLDRLFASISHVLKDDPVPMWDIFAARKNAKEIAENVDPATTAYSRVLDLCPSRIDKSILPYKDYSPILVDKSMVTDESLAVIESAKPKNGDSFIVNDKISPCGSEDYDLQGRTIPKDTSASAILAAAMYRYAQFTDDLEKQQKLIALADKIMHALSTRYRSDKDTLDNNESYNLGFALTQATGNMPEASEINTSIVYADFYFVEANIRKLQLESTK